MFTSTCKKCHKVFELDTKGQPYKSQQAADQARSMHYGRVHSKTIPTYGGGPRKRQLPVLVGSGRNGWRDVPPGNTVATFEASPKRRGRKGKLTHEQSEGLVNFIRTRKNEFTTKTACFTAALEEVGVANTIRNNSVAVSRYFAKAEGKPSEYQKRRGRPPKNSMALAVVEHAHVVPAARRNLFVKNCPRCGLVIDCADEIFELLQESPEVVQLALEAARKMMARKTQLTTNNT